MAAQKGNKYALGNTGGRPAHFETPDLFDKACMDYFDDCDEKGVKATISGLCLYLGFSSRSSLDDYIRRDEFSFIGKRAKLAVENSYEISGQTMDIFALKNMGWRDKVETGVTDKEGNDVPIQPVIKVYTSGPALSSEEAEIKE